MFCEVGIVLEELGFDVFESGSEVFFFLFVALVAGLHGTVDTPVIVVLAKVVVVVTTAALSARLVGGKVGQGFHAHLAGERFAVA